MELEKKRGLPSPPFRPRSRTRTRKRLVLARVLEGELGLEFEKASYSELSAGYGQEEAAFHKAVEELGVFFEFHMRGISQGHFQFLALA